MRGRLRKIRLRVLFVVASALAAFAFIAPGFNAEQPLLKLAIPRGLPADTWDYFLPRTNTTFYVKFPHDPQWIE